MMFLWDESSKTAHGYVTIMKGSDQK